MAAAMGHHECVSILLKSGADVHIFLNVGVQCRSLIVCCVREEGKSRAINGGCFTISIDYSVFVSLSSKENGYTPLLVAAQEGHAECVQLLLKAGAGIHHNKVTRQCLCLLVLFVDLVDWLVSVGSNTFIIFVWRLCTAFSARLGSGWQKEPMAKSGETA